LATAAYIIITILIIALLNLIIGLILSILLILIVATLVAVSAGLRFRFGVPSPTQSDSSVHANRIIIVAIIILVILIVAIIAIIVIIIISIISLSIIATIIAIIVTIIISSRAQMRRHAVQLGVWLQRGDVNRTSSCRKWAVLSTGKQMFIL
jgi:hypothetical protein